MSFKHAIALMALFPLGGGAAAADLEVSLDGGGWDGHRVPKSQVCQRFGGSGATPPLRIANLPAGTTHIEVAFNDQTYGPMDNGGHGVLAFAVAARRDAVSLPAVPGETDNLPPGVTKINGHRGRGWSGTGGAYLPPCSGGRGNTYTATVRAVMRGDAGAKTLARATVGIGRY